MKEEGKGIRVKQENEQIELFMFGLLDLVKG